MSENNKTEQEDSELIKRVRKLPKTALIFGLLLLVPYLLYFHSGFSQEQGDWGAFGDFFGGIMGVVIGLLTLMILAFAYESQREELKETRKELELSRKEQANASKALAEQNRIALRRAKVSELMEASKLIHEELKCLAKETKVEIVGVRGAPNQPVSLERLLANIRKREFEFNQDEVNAYPVDLFNFTLLLLQLCRCFISDLELHEEGGANPLIISLMMYWIMMYDALDNIGVDMHQTIHDAFNRIRDVQQ